MGRTWTCPAEPPMTAAFRMRSRISTRCRSALPSGSVQWRQWPLWGGVLVQCTSAPPLPPAASPPPPATNRHRRRRRARRHRLNHLPGPTVHPVTAAARFQLAPGLSPRAGAAAAGRAQLPRLRRPDPPRRIGRQRRSRSRRSIASSPNFTGSVPHPADGDRGELQRRR